MKSKHREMITGISALVVISLFVLIFCFPINFFYTGYPYKLQALSSIKQIGTATMIYLSDYDERYPATSAMPGTRAVLCRTPKTVNYLIRGKQSLIVLSLILRSPEYSACFLRIPEQNSLS